MLSVLKRGVRFLQHGLRLSMTQNCQISSIYKLKSEVSFPCNPNELAQRLSLQSPISRPQFIARNIFLYTKERDKKRIQKKKKPRFAPSMWKWIHKHGLQARLATPSGREILLKRVVRGDRSIAVFDRIMFDPLPYVGKKQRKSFSQLPPPYKFANTKILPKEELRQKTIRKVGKK